VNLQEKIKLVRKSQKLTQNKFAEVIGIPATSLKKYESGEREPSGKALLKIIECHPQFALWMVTGNTIPEGGQIEPGETKIQMGYSGVPVELLNAAFEQTLTTSIELGWITPKEGVNFSMLADLLRHDFVQNGGRLIEPILNDEANTEAG
jgi:transcriptional regulator with XRE-family HTH domain